MTPSLERRPGESPGGPRPGSPPLFALTLRLAAGATLLGLALVGLQASRAGLVGRSEAPAVEAAPLPPPSPPREGMVPFHGVLDGVKDYEDVAQNRPYAYLAEHVRRLTDDDAKRVLRTDLAYPQLVSAPALYRGEIVRVDGLLVRLEAVRLVPGAGPPGVEDAWRGWIVDTEGDEAYIFDFIGDPPEISNRDMVRMEGAFLKVLRYESRRGQTRDAPFLIARQVRHLAEDEIERAFRYDYVAVVVIGIVGVLLLFQRKRAYEEGVVLQLKREGIARRLKKKAGDA